MLKQVFHDLIVVVANCPDLCQILLQNNMLESPDNRFDMGLCMRSFAPYLFANRRTEKPVIHISLNPDPKDRITDRELAEMAQRYMQAMGYGNQPYIVFKHTDIDRQHLHVVSIRVDENGKKIKSDFENRRSMEICRRLEQAHWTTPAGCGTPRRTGNDNCQTNILLCYQSGVLRLPAGSPVSSIRERPSVLPFLPFRENEDGRIYGVTFIDHGNRTVLNGSRLGKEFHITIVIKHS